MKAHITYFDAEGTDLITEVLEDESAEGPADFITIARTRQAALAEALGYNGPHAIGVTIRRAE